MFKPETLSKYTVAMKAAVKGYENDIKSGKDLSVSISDGNKKIGNVINVSLAPIITCANCSECKHLCYDIKANVQYGAVLNARARNTALALNNPVEYFRQIRARLARKRTNKFFRWHVGGDIPNFAYFTQMVEIAREFPDFRFWTYTKNYAVVNEYVDCFGKLPTNLTVMFSEWRGLPMDNPHGFPEFRVVFKGESRPAGYYCPGNCDICKAAGRGCIGNETTYALEH